MARQDKPDILVMFGDDIGMWNVGPYAQGMLGHTPSIDSIAKDGLLFTDQCGQPGCTVPGRVPAVAGRGLDEHEEEHRDGDGQARPSTRRQQPGTTSKAGAPHGT